MAESGRRWGSPLQHLWGTNWGYNANGDPFVACHHCDFPICKSCYDFDINEGRSECLRCGIAYVYEETQHQIRFRQTKTSYPKTRKPPYEVKTNQNATAPSIFMVVKIRIRLIIYRVLG
ncbi:hypothetical protein K1719_019879 [Acacia pycnantha]|nr:hypothetical protein K1719_019879 [Acacia pycnantha]